MSRLPFKTIRVTWDLFSTKQLYFSLPAVPVCCSRPFRGFLVRLLISEAWKWWCVLNNVFNWSLHQRTFSPSYFVLPKIKKFLKSERMPFCFYSWFLNFLISFSRIISEIKYCFKLWYFDLVRVANILTQLSSSLKCTYVPRAKK